MKTFLQIGGRPGAALLLVGLAAGCLMAPGGRRARDRDFWKAVVAGDTVRVRGYLKRGADVDAVSPGGNTPLSLAAANGHLDTVAYLLFEDADVDAGGPLYQAAKYGYADIAELLIDHQAEVNRPFAAGMTPLHAAVVKENVEMVKLLLMAGADPTAAADVKDIRATPRALAAALKNKDILELFGLTGETEKTAVEQPPGREERTEAANTRGFRRSAEDAVRRKLPHLNLDDFYPGYIIRVDHPAHSERVIVDWLGRDVLDVEEGDTPELDRKKVRKVRVSMTSRGRVLDVVEATTWLYRAGHADNRPSGTGGP